MSALDLAIKLTLLDFASRGVKSAAGQFKALAAAGEETRKHFDRMVDSAKIAAGAALVGRAIYGAMKPGVTAAAELQAQMLGVRNELSGAAKPAALVMGEMEAIKKTAFEIQAWTPFDLTSTVAMMQDLVKAGAKVSDIVGKAGAGAAAAALATQEKMDPSEAAKAVIQVATPFKIAADQYLALADSISRAGSASTTGAAEIAAASKYVSGTAASLNRPIDEMLAMIGMLSNVGVDSITAGTTLNSFYLRAAEYGPLVNANGKLKSTAEIISILRKEFGAMADAQRTSKLKDIFGVEGSRAAVALLTTGKGSYEEMVSGMADALPLMEKMRGSMEGFLKVLDGIKGTAKSDLALMFQPALAPATRLLGVVNDLAAGLGKINMDSPYLANTFTYGGGAAIGGAALVGAGALATGILSGRRLLKGLGGTALGVAQGKALQAATGVNPVYVTNAAEIGGGLGSAPAIVGMGASVKHLAAGVLGGTFAAAIGYAVGTGVNMLITRALGGKSLGETMADPGAARAAAESAFQTNSRAQVARLLRAGKFAEAVKIAEYSGDEALAIRARGARNAALPPVNVSVDVRVDKDGRATAVTKGGNGTTRVNGSRGDLRAR